MTTSVRPSTAPPIKISTRRGWAEIILDRPHRRNAVTPQLATELAEALAVTDDDPDVRAIVLAGAGGAFCSGLDLAALEGDQAGATLRSAWRDVHAALFARRTPVIVALERYAINAGASLMFAADLVVAGEDAFVQTAEITIGMAAPMCQFWLHRHHLTSITPRLVLLGERVDAAELVGSGIVTALVSADAVRSTAVTYAERVAEHPVAGMAAVQHTQAHLDGRPTHRRSAVSLLDAVLASGGHRG